MRKLRWQKALSATDKLDRWGGESNVNSRRLKTSSPRPTAHFIYGERTYGHLLARPRAGYPTMTDNRTIRGYSLWYTLVRADEIDMDANAPLRNSAVESRVAKNWLSQVRTHNTILFANDPGHMRFYPNV